MKPILLFAMLCFYHLGQGQVYWQQKVDHKINVDFDTDALTLTGTDRITYTNNSPDKLRFIYFHLAANAFSSKSSFYAKSQYCLNCPFMLTASKSQLGGYTSLDFVHEGSPMKYQYQDSIHEIVKLFLNTALSPGQSITIDIPFSLKIPQIYVELHYLKESNKLHNWYPVPFVYDKNGWNLSYFAFHGEQFLEFGDYDVSITLPANYYIASSGQIINKEEIYRLDKRISWSRAFLDGKHSDEDKDISRPRYRKGAMGETKTVHIMASHINDFTWYASPDYLISRDSVKLEDGTKIAVYWYFTPEKHEFFQKVHPLINERLQYYSTTYGRYPWPQLSLVTTAHCEYYSNSNTGIISLIESPIDGSCYKLVEEGIAYQWFSHAVHANADNHLWLARGLGAYLYRNLVRKGGLSLKDENEELSDDATLEAPENNSDMLYMLPIIRSKKDQSAHLPVDRYSSDNLIVHKSNYPATVFDYLSAYLGDSLMSDILRMYYEKYKYKHVYPEQFQAIVEKQSPKDLSWVFQGLYGLGKEPKYMDYALTEWVDKKRNIVRIENKGDVLAPVLIQGIVKGVVVTQKWVEGFRGEKDVQLEAPYIEIVELDRYRISPDIRPENQRLKKQGPPKWRSPKPDLIINDNPSTRHTTIYSFPALAYNYHNGIMLGLLLTNYSKLLPSVRYYITPMYGFRSKLWGGIAEINYNYYPSKRRINRIRAGIFARRFASDNTVESYYDIYPDRRISPYLEFKFGWDPQLISEHTLRISYDMYHYDKDFVFEEIKDASKDRFRLEYEYFKRHIRYPFQLNLWWHYGRFGTFKEHFISGAIKGNIFLFDLFHLDYRMFQGVKLGGNNRFLKAGFSLSYTSQADNTYLDNYFFVRNGRSRQILTDREGGFKERIFSESYSNYLSALNLMMGIPHFSNYKIFVDQAIASGYLSDPVDYYLSAGIGYQFEDKIGLYLPLYRIGYSDYKPSRNILKDLKESFSFMIKLKLNLLDSFSFEE